MSINRLTVDTVVLPTLLLDSIKAHARIDYTRDDDLLKLFTASAIGLVERNCNVSINPAEYELTGDELRPRGPICTAGGAWRSRWVLPLNNAREFVLIDGGLVDVSAAYELWSADPGGSGSSYLLGLAGQPLPTGAYMTLKVGVETQAALAPVFFMVIAQMVASMNENREASTDLMASGFADVLGSLWRPDV